MPEKPAVVARESVPAHRVAPAHEGFSTENVISLLQYPREYLSLQLQFHGVPVAGLKVQLSTLAGESVCDAELRSDENGWVRLTTRVPAGIYKCEVEHQEATLVTTVSKLAQPYPLLLPVGRVYAEARGQLAFSTPSLPTQPPTKRPERKP